METTSSALALKMFCDFAGVAVSKTVASKFAFDCATVVPL
jgi:hypothetical protein